MKPFITALFLLCFFSCKRNVPDMPETIEPNMLIMQSGTDTLKVPITGEALSYSTTADLFLIAQSPEIDMRLTARSYTHSLGAGNYFFTCCENEVMEKFAGGQYYDGVADGTINNIGREKGNLTITNINTSGYWGTFSFIGQNAVGEKKEFTGKFRVAN
jgi:hypothetical protein